MHIYREIDICRYCSSVARAYVREVEYPSEHEAGRSRCWSEAPVSSG